MVAAAEEIDELRAGWLYLPTSHAKALDPSAVVVSGIRGSGKTYWWNALARDDLFRLVAEEFPRYNLARFKVVQAFGEKPGRALWPTRTINDQLLQSYSGETIWRAVLMWRIEVPGLPDITRWSDRCEWIDIGRSCAGSTVKGPRFRTCYAGLMDLESELRDRLSTVEAVRFALLFGSREREDHRQDSDLDVAVFLDPSLSRREQFDLRLALIHDLAELGEADVVVLNDAPPLLGHRALRGRPILMRDRTAYVRFAVRTLGRAADQRPYDALQRRERQRRLQGSRYGRP